MDRRFSMYRMNRRLFVITYVNDNPNNPRIERWFRPTAKGIMEIFKNPHMSWLKEEEFTVSSVILGKMVGGQAEHVTSDESREYYYHSSDDKDFLCKGLRKTMKADELGDFDYSNLYECSKCETIYNEMGKCCDLDCTKINDY